MKLLIDVQVTLVMWKLSKTVYVWCQLCMVAVIYEMGAASCVPPDVVRFFNSHHSQPEESEIVGILVQQHLESYCFLNSGIKQSCSVS